MYPKKDTYTLMYFYYRHVCNIIRYKALHLLDLQHFLEQLYKLVILV